MKGGDLYMITMALDDGGVWIYRQAALAAVWRGRGVTFVHYILYLCNTETAGCMEGSARVFWIPGR